MGPWAMRGQAWVFARRMLRERLERWWSVEVELGTGHSASGGRAIRAATAWVAVALVVVDACVDGAWRTWAAVCAYTDLENWTRMVGLAPVLCPV